ncbi:3-hydroxy-3-methylglutaryl-coenzyme A reductase [Astathelohania contejeani]|uniref:hydroxymethylglutaryl-CoA reductase (NADPH) n=1 Tax=Astathelohania contejeani TaxID=164912 RepID=A0ABQ7I2Q4_9MICR|nr:3-hydroxy-3-methylglutaryl-coenzyme A reductase [Thelohania contejeani]
MAKESDCDAIIEKAKEKAKMLIKNMEEYGLKIEGVITDEDLTPVIGRCCENVLGYQKMPLGVSNRALRINNKEFWIPICTTEGALVASMCRGIKLLNECGGIEGSVENLGMTRGFAIGFPNFGTALKFYRELPNLEEELSDVGNSTSRFLKIKEIKAKQILSKTVFIKVSAYTGDAMGMNMITKACNKIAHRIMEMYPGSRLVCISANTCTDKKWSAENFVNGRGRRIFLNVKISEEKCKEILGVNIYEIYKVYHTKIVLGSGLALASGNCQAANYVAGIFIALGQDVAQVLESSNCMLSMEIVGNELEVSLFMPSLCVGSIGGGTHLEPQKSFISQFYLEDNPDFFITDRKKDPGVAPNWMALAIAGAVLAGELSLLGSLADNSLMNAHLKLNRKK